jgi:Mrp family chromosome partitioning ATPase/phosphoglycolate phosphatase-like HAD superfamily hydrolase
VRAETEDTRDRTTSGGYGIPRYAQQQLGGRGTWGSPGWEALPRHAREIRYEDHHVQFSDVITSFRNHWRAAVAVVVLVGVGLGLFLFLSDQTRPPDSWRAATQILVPARDDKGNLPEDVPPMLLQSQSSMAQSSGVIDAALANAGLDKQDPDDFTFDFESNERGDIVTLAVTAPTEDQARDLANAYGSAFGTARRQAVAAGSRGTSQGAEAALTRLQERFTEVEDELQRIDPELLAKLPDTAEPLDEDTATEEQSPGIDLPATTPIETQKLAYERQDLLRRIESARRNYAEGSTTAIVPDGYATIVERVTPEDITSAPPTPLIPIGVAVGVGALLALGVPVVLDRIDHSIRDSRAAGAALAAPVLSTIPAPPASHRDTLARPGSPRSHAYRTLATASIATDQLPRAIVVTAPIGQMQDSVAANFAAALADLGLRVALVPTDRRQAWYADAPDGALTLPDFLALAYTGRLNGEVPHQLQPTPVDNLRILPHGDAEADALIDGLPPLLRAFTESGVDVTVIAAPSMLEDPSATILAWSTRSVLWVVETGEVTQQQASEAAAKLELAGASPFGVAVVDGKG